MRLKLFVLFVFTCLIGFSQTTWESIENRDITRTKNAQRDNFPSEFSLYSVSATSIKTILQQSPNRLTASNSNVIISIPNNDGILERFRMFEFSNFHPQLQAQFPDIRSYVGQGIDDKTAVLRMSVDPTGIQAMILRADKPTQFIEPYSADGSVYAVFHSNRNKGQLPFVCSTEDHAVSDRISNSDLQNKMSDTGQLLIFRLALSCNGEYAQYFGGTVNAALNAMNATMTRVNGVFEMDFAIHMSLIPNNHLVVYTNPATDPYTTMANWNSQLQTTLTNVIGEGNYDVGHMFGATGGGGSAGCIGCVCVDGIKGRGITSPSNGVPMGDTFDIDYVAHELGHQFGANHTFSHNVESTGANVEPGSGSTIMGYAGITTRDVQSNSDAYFVYASIKQVQDNMATKTCPQRVNLTNLAPILNAGPDYVIPKSTPFILTAIATDPNGDPLTYCWEQNDTATNQTGAASGASATKTGGPNWRSYTPTSNPSRYFPRIQSIVANQSTTAGLEITVEALSSVSRTLNFICTARDNFAGAGQTKSDDVRITVDAVSGPFVVTAPNTAISWTVGTQQTVTWDVAGTTGNGVNAQFVDIYLSTDGGFTYPILLASKVPNDGSETITVPNNAGANNRIMVRGYRHVFFDISNANFTIAAPTSTFAIAFNGVAEQQNKDVCTGGSITYTIPYTTYGGFSGNTTFTAAGLPPNATASFSPSQLNSTGTVTMTITTSGTTTIGSYNITVNATSGTTTRSIPFYLNVFSSNFTAVSLTSPANQAVGQQLSLNLTWQPNANATLYDVEVSIDPNFATVNFSGTVAGTSFALNNLAQATQYYWRVKPKNSACGGTFSQSFLFKTGQSSCGNTFSSTNVPIVIPTTANVTVNSILNISDTGTISDVNVNLNITHTWVNDMTITLISPLGTQVQLVAQPCTSANLQNIVATFDDSASPIICGTNPAISGIVRPIQQLSAFNGENLNGTWTLRVLDSFNQDGGSINSWSLDICKLNTVPLANNEVNFQNFSLYPNPNKGNFNISFTSNTSNAITVNVFDIRGRNVHSKSYSNNGLFNESINLTNVQAGIYLVKVQDGDKQITKKIVIE